jgi:hypothetical protein
MIDPDRWIACLPCEIHNRHTGMWTDGDYTEGPTDLCLMPGEHVPATIELDQDDMRRCLFGGTATDGEMYLARRALDCIDLEQDADRPAFVEYLRDRPDLPFSPDSARDFERSYKGQYTDRAAYAKHYAETVGEWSAESAAWPSKYIDWDRAARELFDGAYRWTLGAPHDEVYVFGDEK